MTNHSMRPSTYICSMCSQSVSSIIFLYPIR
nr:MAG TPA_asm: C2H2 type zinc-finger protein [Caudoviricetes sp.]